jgi:hypothetical protein
MKYGYARVSTDGQSVAAQAATLNAAGARKVFREVASGAKTDRSQLGRAIATLGAGDVLMVTRLARLARSTRDLLNTVASAGEPVGRFSRRAWFCKLIIGVGSKFWSNVGTGLLWVAAYPEWLCGSSHRDRPSVRLAGISP